MLREIKTDKNMLELNPHGHYGFPFWLSYITMSAYPSGRFICHWHPEIEIVNILDGEMYYQINQNTYQLTTGDCLFVNSNALHSGNVPENNDCNYIVATFNPSLVYGYEKSDIDTNYTFPLLNADSFSSFVFHDKSKEKDLFQKNMQEIGELFQTKPSCYELLTKSRLCELWAIIFTKFRQQQTFLGSNLTESKQIARLKDALLFIHAHYAEAITLEQMTEACHTSKSEFCRIFKKTLHQTPFEYLLRYRIQKSLPLLAGDGHSITEIAYQVGFSGSSYYSEVFRKYMNCSPREYKKNISN